MIYYLVYSFSLIAVWGLLFLSVDRPGLIGVFIGMLYTFYSSYVIRQFIEKEKWSHFTIKMLGPTIYFVATLVLLPLNTHILLSPISIGFLIVLFSSFDQHIFPKRHIQFFVVFFLYLYSFTLFNSWWKKNSLLDSDTKINYNFELKDSIDSKESTLNLANHYFINSSLDSVPIFNSNKYTLVETWNERCPPCMKAIPAMKPIYDSLESQINQFYVYIPNIELDRLDLDKVFNFELIVDKSRIVIDVDLQEKARLSSYPCFLLFDPTGKLIFIHKGFNPEKKEDLVKKISSSIKPPQ